jgi:hypothetical protein
VHRHPRSKREHPVPRSRRRSSALPPSCCVATAFTFAHTQSLLRLHAAFRKATASWRRAGLGCASADRDAREPGHPPLRTTSSAARAHPCDPPPAPPNVRMLRTLEETTLGSNFTSEIAEPVTDPSRRQYDVVNVHITHGAVRILTKANTYVVRVNSRGEYDHEGTPNPGARIYL